MKRGDKNPYRRCLLAKDFPIQTHNDQPIDFWPDCPIPQGESSEVIKLNSSLPPTVTHLELESNYL